VLATYRSLYVLVWSGVVHGHHVVRVSDGKPVFLYIRRYTATRSDLRLENQGDTEYYLLHLLVISTSHTNWCVATAPYLFHLRVACQLLSTPVFLHAK
jgi:hypothetical protein